MNSFLSNVILLAVIIIILSLGHNPYFQKLGGDLYDRAEAWVKSIWQNAVDFWNLHILGKVSSEIDKRQEIVKKEINNQAQQVGQTIWQQITDYFSGLVNGIFGRSGSETNK